MSALQLEQQQRSTYNVWSNDPAVEVERQAPEAKLDSDPLESTERRFLVSCWDGVSMEDAARRVEVCRHMIGEQFLQELFARLWCLLWNFLKCLVSGCKQSVVGFRAVKQIHEVIIFVDQLCKLRRIL